MAPVAHGPGAAGAAGPSRTAGEGSPLPCRAAALLLSHAAPGACWPEVRLDTHHETTDQGRTPHDTNVASAPWCPKPAAAALAASLVISYGLALHHRGPARSSEHSPGHLRPHHFGRRGRPPPSRRRDLLVLRARQIVVAPVSRPKLQRLSRESPSSSRWARPQRGSPGRASGTSPASSKSGSSAASRDAAASWVTRGRRGHAHGPPAPGKAGSLTPRDLL